MGFGGEISKTVGFTPTGDPMLDFAATSTIPSMLAALFVNPERNSGSTFIPLRQPHCLDYGRSATIPQSLAVGNITFIPRRPSKSQAQLTTTLLWRILASFPTMIERKETLPPFIHPMMLCGEVREETSMLDTPETLVNCMSIVQMWKLRQSQTNGLVWRTIRMELEKMWVEHGSYTDWQLLACQQTVLTYLLMRMREGARVNDDIDAPLIFTLGRVSKTLVNRIGNAEFITGVPNAINSCSEWIFHETRRRIATIARLINMVLDIDSAVVCYLLRGFVFVPLPAQRTLWETNTTASWRKEFDLFLRDRRLYGLAADGKLKSLVQQDDGQVVISIVDWESWLAEQDTFGTMVMLAGSLLEANASADTSA
ncbi:hypothetical protein NA57DRAFT_52367 [Rhizodiscina lignyota]|uniref:Uncharacterized protein n=1 Tax=Rhizodiscina lignyota TaxID=1504668 RepID=A0A9P4IJP4_9PEZI|nr:hypothetical protein NA57DRAFT_52367 [Rhizodiscina lignyota]